MNSLFKFPCRVRIHGGECGAVARALHHEVKGSSLYQADSGKALGSTIERKQMSTKTTLKRIALVAVSALGLGLMSIVPANATSTHTVSSALSTSSITVITDGTAGSNDGAFFYVDLTDNEGLPRGLYASESISVTTIADPDGAVATGTQLTDLTISAVTNATGTFAAVAGDVAGRTGTKQVPDMAAVGAYDSGNWSSDSSTDATKNNEENRYWFHVAPNSAALDAGAYTLRVRVHALDADTSQRVLIDKTLTINYLSSVAGASSARITVTKAGDLYKDESLTYTTSQYVKAVLDNGTTGGRLQVGKAVTDTLASTAPTLSAAIYDDGVFKQNLTAPADTGVAATDHVATTSTNTSATTYQTYREAGNGSYGVTGSITTAASVLTTVEVRLPGSSVSGSVSMIVRASSGAVDSKTDAQLEAAGISTANAALKSNITDTTTAYTLPTTTTSAKLTLYMDDSGNADVAGVAFPVTFAWSGNYASASVTPAATASTSTGTLYTSSSTGSFVIDVTNSAPVAGAVLTITVKGYKYVAGTSSSPSAGSRVFTLTWATPTVTTLTILDPVDGIDVATGSTTTFTVGAYDQFGNAMSGIQIQPSIPSTSANGSATTTYAVITTGSDGAATFSVTDATKDATLNESVTFTAVANSSATDSYTIDYVTALPTVSTVNVYYNLTHTTASPAVVVPSTGIYADAAGTKLIIKNNRNLSKTLAAITDETTDDMVAFRISSLTSTGAAAEGAKVTVTASTGGHILSATGLPVTSRTFAVDSAGDVVFQALATAPGAITFSITSGTKTASAAMWVATPTASAGRYVTISGAATGTSYGDPVAYTVKVTDRYGNAVTGAELNVTASGVASFTGGATMQSFTTDSTGTYTFQGTSTVAAGGVGGFTASAKNATDAAQPAGYSVGVAVDSTLTAGVSSASVSTTFAAGVNPAVAAAEAATDAAAEAIDAANAATDAANLADEAADAATVAAEEARDAADAATAAVEELATQVATLMAALKAQITTLANTVAKIAKKVKA